MPELSSALSAVGLGEAAARSFGQAVDAFSAQNISPSALAGVSSAIRNAVETSIPPILRVPPVAGTIDFVPKGNEWTSVHYADDLIAHAPKFKFLFKVSFIGFGEREFQYYVHRCDKPKVALNHTDVNYYNFRTRVLTSVTYLPLNMSLLDETGNSVNNFFASYLAKQSNTGGGGWGTEAGFGGASGTLPYENRGYSQGKRIIIEQVFANGLYSNLFELINPRIENFDFDELNMEDSSSGSMLNLTVSYDALQCSTVKLNNMYTWGATDLRKGGGSSGLPNSGASSSYDAGVPTTQSANGAGIDGIGPLAKAAWETTGRGLGLQLPASLQGLNAGVQQISTALKAPLSSAGDILSRNVSQTLASITGGFSPPASTFTFNAARDSQAASASETSPYTSNSFTSFRDE